MLWPALANGLPEVGLVPWGSSLFCVGSENDVSSAITEKALFIQVIINRQNKKKWRNNSMYIYKWWKTVICKSKVNDNFCGKNCDWWEFVSSPTSSWAFEISQNLKLKEFGLILERHLRVKAFAGDWIRCKMFLIALDMLSPMKCLHKALHTNVINTWNALWEIRFLKQFLLRA